MKSTLVHLFNKFGFKILNYSTKRIRLQQGRDSPLSFLIDEPESNELVFDIPLSVVRSWGGRSLDASLNPFIDIMQELKNSNKIDFSGSALAKLSGIRKCNNASDTLGVDSDYFAKLSPHLAVYPWDKIEPVSKIEGQKKTLRNELSQYLNSNTTSERLLRPETRGKAEIRRIRFLYESIRKNGFSETHHNFEPLEGQLLVRSDNDWIVLIRQGEHRIAALKALEYESAPILIRKSNIIRETDVNYWWQVVQNRISSKEALSVFNSIFKGDQNAPLINIVGYFI